jgi:hypothetical protein
VVMMVRRRPPRVRDFHQLAVVVSSPYGWGRERELVPMIVLLRPL